MSDPWSRRQNPIKVPKLSFNQRFGCYFPIAGVILGVSIFYSRLIYDLAFRRWFQPDTVSYINLDTTKLGLGRIANEEENTHPQEFAIQHENRIIMGLLALGSLSVFFSEPMLSGFVTGAAMHVISAQLRDLLDIKVSRRKGAFKALLSLYDIVAHITELNWMTALFGISAMLFIYQGQLLNERFKAKLFMPLPMELVTVVVATILSYFIGLQEKYGSSIMGHIPTGVPRVSLPEVSLFPLMIKDALIIAFISYVIALSLGKTFGRRNRYNVDANQELVAMGGANVFGSFIDCFPCAASLSRSSVQEKAGGKTQLTTIFSSMFLFFTILFAGPLFFYLPKCVLSSIIIVALKDMLFQVYDCIRCSKISFIESGVWLSTFLAVFIIDLEYGIVAGPLTTVVALLYRDSRPRVRFVSSMFCEGLFIESMNGATSTSATGSGKEVLLARIESEVNFVNRDALKEQLLSHMSDELLSSSVFSGLLILDLTRCPFVDCSGCVTLKELVMLFTAREFHVSIVGASEDVIEFMMLINDPKVTFNPTLKDIAFDMSAAALPESHRF